MKNCKQCGKELVKKVWLGKRVYYEASTRFSQRQYCDNVCRSKQLAEMPVEQNYFYGKHLVPHNKGKGKGWRSKDEKGYIKIYTDQDHWQYEHRLVAEKHYRKINPDEVVHHINWDKADNRPENLLIVTRREHKKHHVTSKVTP